VSDDEQERQASADPLNEEQAATQQSPEVEVTHPDAFARKQYEATTADPDSLVGSGNNPTDEQGGVGVKQEDLKLDPSQDGE
jgi:hypothetical protein